MGDEMGREGIAWRRERGARIVRNTSLFRTARFPFQHRRSLLHLVRTARLGGGKELAGGANKVLFSPARVVQFCWAENADGREEGAVTFQRCEILPLCSTTASRDVEFPVSRGRWNRDLVRHFLSDRDQVARPVYFVLPAPSAKDVKGYPREAQS